MNLPQTPRDRLNERMARKKETRSLRVASFFRGTFFREAGSPTDPPTVTSQCEPGNFAQVLKADETAKDLALQDY